MRSIIISAYAVQCNYISWRLMLRADNRIITSCKQAIGELFSQGWKASMISDSSRSCRTNSCNQLIDQNKGWFEEHGELNGSRCFYSRYVVLLNPKIKPPYHKICRATPEIPRKPFEFIKYTWQSAEMGVTRLRTMIDTKRSFDSMLLSCNLIVDFWTITFPFRNRKDLTWANHQTNPRETKRIDETTRVHQHLPPPVLQRKHCPRARFGSPSSSIFGTHARMLRVHCSIHHDIEHR